MVRFTYQRGFTQEGWLVEVRELRVFGVRVWHREDIDSLTTQELYDKANAPCKGIGFDVEPQSPPGLCVSE